MSVPHRSRKPVRPTAVRAARMLASSIVLAAQALATPTASGSSGTEVELLLEVEINGVSKAEPALVRDGSPAGILLRAADLASWGVRPPSSQSDPIANAAGLAERYIAVTAVPGLRARIDFARQRLIVAAAPELLPPVNITLEDAPMHAPTPSIPGAFIGYDIVASDEDAMRFASGQFETGAFAGVWATSTTWLASTDAQRVATRLDTFISRDWPDRMLALRLGDGITTPGDWGGAVRLGGIHWGTDFGVRPDFITFPLPAMRGEAVVPATVDVYVNGALRARREVAPGPFKLSDLPVVSGNGDVQLVVRDALGREQRIEQPYFASTDLLRAGLSQYSVEVGAVREDYGLQDFRYGRGLMVSGIRHGLTDRLTGALRAELSPHEQTAGASLTTLIVPGLALSAALARSEAEHSGTLAQIALDMNRRTFNAGVRLRTATVDFRQLGLMSGQSAPRRALDARVGMADPERRQFRADFRGPRSAWVTRCSCPLVHVWRFARRAGLSRRLRDLRHAGARRLLVALALTRPMGDRTSSRLTSRRERGGVSVGAAMNRNLPAGSGTGFYLEAETGEISQLSAGATLQNEAGRLGIQADQIEQRMRYRASASGGLLLLDGKLAAVRDITNESSFGIVEVPARAGVPVYHENHAVGVTDERGFAMLSGLRPFEANHLRIDPNDLPIDAAVSNTEFIVRPYRRGAVHVAFPVSGGGGAIVHLMREAHGIPIPAGARVNVGDKSFTVAADGAVYVTGVTGEVTLEARWSVGRCTAHVSISSDRLLPDLGPVICREPL